MDMMMPDFWRFDLYGAPGRAKAGPRQERARASVGRAARVAGWAAEDDDGASRGRGLKSTATIVPSRGCTGHPPAVPPRDVPIELLLAASSAAEIASAALDLPRLTVRWFTAPPGGPGSTWLGFFCGCSPMTVYVRADHPGDVAESVFHEVRHAEQHRADGPAVDDAGRERREAAALAFGGWMARQMRDLGPERALRRARGDCQ
jgi:hypothetical protein